MQDYDRTSKWLIQHHGDSILRIAGVRDLVSWRPLQAELVQPRQLPDGLIEASHAGQAEPNLYVLEIATYPDERLIEQVLRDMTLVYLDRRVLPEILTLILHPKGNLKARDAHDLQSPRGWTNWQARWRTVELWTIPAADLLATGDLGAIPWVPLAQLTDPPETVLQECRERIDSQASDDERDNLLAVTQVFTRLRYNDLRLLTILGGGQAMIESPLIQEIVAKRMHKDILQFLQGRFGPVAPDIGAMLQAIEHEAELEDLVDFAVICPDLDAFRARLQTNSNG